eukprot:m.118848 g.118848  ORF g.118848 m.118848 type:complete len:570 (-) comp28703_c0_seq2:56-1765(-)
MAYAFVPAPDAFRSRRPNAQQKMVGFAKGAAVSLRRKGFAKGSLTSAKGLEFNIPPSKKSDEDWEFDRNDLGELTEIGSGQFGNVYIGVAKNIVKGQEKTKVAVKELSADSDGALADFTAETKIMKAIDNPNIVRLLGVCSKEKPRYMIMEFMSKGDLKAVLYEGRPSPVGPAAFSQRQLAVMGANISRGMNYLGDINIVHRDLAARNCLVDTKLEVKIGDFGLTRNTYSREYYRMTGSSPMPIRWMAVESLGDGVFSTQTDVWSFGVVLYEIFAFGALPYLDYDNHQVAKMVAEDDYRLPKPLCCPSDIYELMEQCWEEDGDDRVTFKVAYERLIDAAKSANTMTLGYAEVCDEFLMTQWTESPSWNENPSYFYDGNDTNDDDGVQRPQESSCYDNTEQSVTDIDGAYDNVEFVADKLDNATLQPPETPRTNKNNNNSNASGYEVPTPSPTKTPKSAESQPDKELADICQWVTHTTGKTVEPSTFHASLRSGETLCVLMNKLKPVSIRKINLPKNAIKMMENISKFIDAAKSFGISDDDLFDTDDLFEDLDMSRVLFCLISLKEHSEK